MDWNAILCTLLCWRQAHHSSSCCSFPVRSSDLCISLQQVMQQPQSWDNSTPSAPWQQSFHWLRLCRGSPRLHGRHKIDVKWDVGDWPAHAVHRTESVVQGFSENWVLGTQSPWLWVFPYLLRYSPFLPGITGYARRKSCQSMFLTESLSN